MAGVRRTRCASVRSWFDSLLRILLVASLAAATGGYAANYVYDANGRLRAVTTTTGDSAEYVYDALGNLYAVNATPAAGLSIFTFAPNHGPVGSSVHISGQGFSATPGNNTVKFNGTVVTSVAGATSSTLDVTVPPGATAGPISVQVGSNTATSIDNFYVTTDSGGQPPTIDSFSPAVVTAGSTVTVTGSHFVASTGSTAAGVNQLLSTVTPASDTQLAFVVPQQTGSGPVTVTTPYGAAESATSLIVIPSTVGVGNVITTGNLTVDGASQAITIGTANKYAAITFDATGGELISLQFDQWSISPSTGAVSVTVYDSAGTAVTPSQNVSVSAGLSVHLPVLKRTGTYLVLLSPSNATTQFSLRVESALVLTETPSGINLQASQSRRAQFIASTTYEGISPSPFSTTPAGGSLNMVVSDSRGATIAGWNATSGQFFNLPALTPGATYSVMAQTTTSNSVSAQLALAPNPVVDVTVNGSLASARTTYSGQNAYLTFNASQGENVGLGITNLVMTDNSANKSFGINYAVNQPGGATWKGTQCQASTSGCELNLSNAPVTGTYTVVVSPWPYGTGTASFNTTLSDDVVVRLPANTATSMSLGRNGQNGRYTFAGTAGTPIALQIVGLTTVPANRGVSFSVYNPDGTYLSGTSFSSDSTLNVANLPTTGTYTLFVDPSYGATANMSATLAVGTKVAVAVGDTKAVSTTLSGQTAYFSFNATQGENLGLGITNLIVTDSSINKSFGLSYAVYKPDGNVWLSGQCQASTNGCELNLSNAPATATYNVVVSPWPYGTGALSFNVTLSDDLVVALPANTATGMSLSQNGQNGRYTFSGTAGATVGLQIGGITTVPANQLVALQVLRPDGTQLSGASISTATGTTFNLSNLPLTGTYTVFVSPYYAATATLTATLIVNTATPLSIGGSASAISTTVSGQNANLSFTATAGENLGLGLTNLVVTDNSTPKSTYANVAVYKPDGSYWVGGPCNLPSPGSGCDFNLSNVPVAGTYSVVVSPNSNTGLLSFNATLSDDVVVPLPMSTATAMNLSLNGQNGRYTFSGTAGTAIALQIGGIATVPANQPVSLQVLKPDGTALSGANVPTATGTTFNLTNLPATGTYTVFVNPYYAATATLTATLIVNAATPLSVGGSASAVSTTVGGQNIYLNFAATAGENLGLGLTNLVVTDNSTPKSTYANVSVYKPDGSYWAGGACYPTSPGGGCEFNLSNAPTTGTYSVVVVLNSGTGALSFNATLSDDLVVALPTNTTTAMSLSLNGQNGRYTFSGTAGATMVLQIGMITTVPANQPVVLQVLKPDGTQLSGANVPTATGTTFNLRNLPATGTYTVFVNPVFAATATLAATLAANAATPLSTSGNASAVNTTVSGQIAYLSFTATAGENLGLGIMNLAIADTSTPKSTYAYVTVYKPDGTSWASVSCSPANPGNGCDLNLTNAPVAGTYSVVVSPNSGTGTLSFNATLSDDLVVALPADTATAMNLSLNGQNGRYTFSGTAGTTVGLQIGGITTVPANQSVNLQVLKPDGTQLSVANASSTGTTFNLTKLPATGTYTVFVNPSFAATATLTATLVTNATVTVGGAASTITTALNGVPAYFNFTATAGENLGLAIMNLAVTDSSANKSFGINYMVYAPDGSSWRGTQCPVFSNSCELNLSNAPATGTYSVVASPWPYGTGTVSFNAMLSDDVVVALPANTATAMSLSRNGQNGRYTFSGTAGTAVALRISGISTVPANQNVTFVIYKPDGGSISGGGSLTSDNTFNLANLPTTGTYTLFVDPSYGATANLTVTLAVSTPVTVTVGGDAKNVTTTLNGQSAYFTFNATQGENLGMGITNLVVTDSSTNKSFGANYTVNVPNGGTWKSVQCQVSSNGCELNLGNAPATGTYSVIANPWPYSTGAVSFNAMLSDDVVVALPAGTATAMNLSRNGQNGRYTFSGAAGTTVGLQVGGITTVPANQSLNLQVFKPDGTGLSGGSATATTSTTLNLTNLPTTGTYTLFVDPSYAATANLSATLTVSQ